MEELNELEKIGLAFISGLVAGNALKEADQEVKEDNIKDIKDKVMVGKIEGEYAEEFMKMIKKLGGE